MPLLNEKDYLNFVKYSADADLGWDQSSNPDHQLRENCIGEFKTYTDYPNKIRSNNSSFNPLDAPVIVAGDSFTYGTDENDDETYPAFLEKALNVPVANLGVAAIARFRQ